MVREGELDSVPLSLAEGVGETEELSLGEGELDTLSLSLSEGVKPCLWT